MNLWQKNIILIGFLNNLLNIIEKNINFNIINKKRNVKYLRNKKSKTFA